MYLKRINHQVCGGEQHFSVSDGCVNMQLFGSKLYIFTLLVYSLCGLTLLSDQNNLLILF